MNSDGGLSNTITQKELNEAMAQFEDREKRSRFYPMFCDMMDKGQEIEAYLFILATWNVGAFRFAVKEFDIDGFRETMEGLNPFFNKLRNESFNTIDLDRYKEEIVTIFATLSKIPGIKYTGTSKIMHLRNRAVFVMWDAYINGNGTKRHYYKLEIVKEGTWKFRKYTQDGEGYFQFLKDMQVMFKGLNSGNNKKTLAKAIDEYNYVNITKRIQDMEKKEAEEKKMQKRKQGKPT